MCCQYTSQDPEAGGFHQFVGIASDLPTEHIGLAKRQPRLVARRG